MSTPRPKTRKRKEPEPLSVRIVLPDGSAVPPSEAHIDWSLVPDHVMLRLLKHCIRETQAYFEQPGVPEAFEAWQRQQQAEAKKSRRLPAYLEEREKEETHAD